MTPSFFRLKSWRRAGASVACLASMLGGYVTAAAAASPANTAQAQYTGDLIIKWRDDTSGTRKTLSASEASNRLLSVAQAAGSTLQVKRTLATNAQLMHTGLTDAASIQASADKKESLPIPPVLGALAIVGGVVLVAVGARRA